LPTSSSIYTAQVFFNYAIMEDSKRIGRTFWARAVRKVMLFASRLISKAAMRLFDKGPLDDTKLPIGWVAKGYKEGTKRIGRAYPSKEALINSIAQCDRTLVLRDGRIVPK